MKKTTFFKVSIEFKNGEVRFIEMTDVDVDTMLDKMWGRDPVKWMNVWEHIINFEDVRYVNYKELEEEE